MITAIITISIWLVLGCGIVVGYNIFRLLTDILDELKDIHEDVDSIDSSVLK